MKEKITFFVTSNSTGPIKKVTLSKRLLKSFAFLLSVFIAVGTALTMDYFSLRHRHRGLSLEGPAGLQAGFPEGHLWPQVQKLTHEINQIKTKLARISALEEKLRRIARTDLDSEKNRVGMGGPFPEDLDPKVEIHQKPGELLLEMRRQMEDLHQMSVQREENLERLLKTLERRQELFSRTPTGRPTPGRISSGFGWRRSPFTGQREFHSGMDIATYRGAPVTAPADGVVTAVGRNGGLGKVLVLDHGYGVVTRYGHLSKTLKKPGDRVKRGDVIARVGNTGRSTGPHLHYEILAGKAPVNPKKFVFN